MSENNSETIPSELKEDKEEAVDKSQKLYEDALASIRDVQNMWKDFSQRFDQAMKQSLANAFGICVDNISESEKQQVLSGNPTIEELAKRIRKKQCK